MDSAAQEDADRITLASGQARATVALRGAEPVSWQVDGRELLWSGDPAHWNFHAPILFPRVGASTGGTIEVGGSHYPMAQHGFARRAAFELVEHGGSSARLRLTDSAETRTQYPFGFRLDILVALAARSLSLAFEVTNTDAGRLPYALGFHPAFPWPLDGAGRDGHRVTFQAEERPEVPEVAAGGLLARRSRSVPIEGRTLPLSPDLFSEALVFLDARSSAFSFAAPSGAAMAMETKAFPHLAIWSRPEAPFLSLECWSGHADWEDASGELAERASMTVLKPDETGRHWVALRWSPTRSPAGSA